MDRLATLRTLWKQGFRRFREAQLGQVAGSLTFTTLLALVPLFTVVLALFSVFPAFARLEVALQQYFLQALVPDTIAGPVLRTMTQFAGKATRLGTLGLVGVVITALALLLTIDRALNRIWRVRRPRPLGYRVVVYLAALSLGPLAASASFALAASAFRAAQGWAPELPGLWRTVWGVLESGCLLLGVMGLYRWLPNTQVRWRDAFFGGLFVVVTFSMAKALLGWYVSAVTSFAVVYGAFATLPILLLWIYIVWILILAGALVAAHAPGLGGGGQLDTSVPGGRFTLALAIVRQLAAIRDGAEPSRDVSVLAREVGADLMTTRAVLDRLREWGWVDLSDGLGPTAAGWYLRLHPRHCPLALPVQAWLLPLHAENRQFLEISRLAALSLADVLLSEVPPETPGGLPA